ncbi:MAG: hypothetical protein HS115_11855 [Spirochaetales bacterium]|nr:hypothetical protein [Spirochaetales bacterium]
MKRLLITILIAAGLFIGLPTMAVLIYYLATFVAEKQYANVNESKPPTGPFREYRFSPDFVLGSGSSPNYRYLGVSILYPEENERLHAELTNRSAQLRNLVNLTLQGTDPTAHADIDFKRIAESLKASFNQVLTNGPVTAVILK